MKHNRFAAIVILVLAVLTAAAAGIHLATRTPAAEGALRVEQPGGVAHVRLDELELAPVQGAIRNGKGDELTVDGQGALLSVVLERAGVTEFARITVTADDEYSAVVTAEEVFQPDKVYLILENGGMRLVVFGDENSKRNVSDVVSLTVS